VFAADCAIGVAGAGGCLSGGGARIGSPSWTANLTSYWKAGLSGV
jgi:hypothetical protein